MAMTLLVIPDITDLEDLCAHKSICTCVRRYVRVCTPISSAKSTSPRFLSWSTLKSVNWRKYFFGHGAERSFREAERFRQDVTDMKTNVSVVFMSIFWVIWVSVYVYSCKIKPSVKQTMVLAPFKGDSAASGRCKKSMQVSAWCIFLLPINQAQQQSRVQQCILGHLCWEVRWLGKPWSSVMLRKLQLPSKW